MKRMLMMLTADDRAGVEQLLRTRMPVLAEVASSSSAQLRVACQVEHDPLLAQAGEGRVLVSLQGMVELSFAGTADPNWSDVARTLVDVLSGDLDWSASTLVAGTVHEVLPAASEELLLVMGARRAPAIDHARFCDYWLGTHAPLALSMLDADGRARMGYQQLHADLSQSALAAAAAGVQAVGFDGVLQVGLSTFEDLPHARVPGFAEAILADEANFADQSAEMRGAFMFPLRVGDGTPDPTESDHEEAP